MTKDQLESIRAREKAETNRTPKHIYHFSETEWLYAHAHKDIRLLLAEIDSLRRALNLSSERSKEIHNGVELALRDKAGSEEEK